MIIGVPRERKILEQRVALTPYGAQELTSAGHEVRIEKGAGEGSHFLDHQYIEAGCRITDLAQVWSSELVVKVKEPHPEEYAFFRQGLAVFDYLHLASLPELTHKMVEQGLIGIAYELVKSDDGRLPLLEPMSEVAGKLAVLNGSYFLLAQNGGRGVLLGGTVGVAPAKVTILGAGTAGRAACQVASGAGADVTVLDLDFRKLEHIHDIFGPAVRTVHSSKSAIHEACVSADLLIGAVLIPGAAAPKLVSKETIREMKTGSVFVDISVDQGGCGETTTVTSLKDPTKVIDGVIHYGVPNMPAQTPRTSTMALTAATLPYVKKIADLGVEKALRENKQLRTALNTYNGLLTNEAVSNAVKMQHTPVEKALVI